MAHTVKEFMEKFDYTAHADFNPWSPTCSTCSFPDYHDTDGTVATFYMRVRQAVLGDYSCDYPATASIQGYGRIVETRCEDANGNPQICQTTKACLEAQYADVKMANFEYLTTLSDPTSHADVYYYYETALNPETGVKYKPDFILEFPYIRLRATDAAGNGVPGLRVRLNPMDSMFPHMPSLAKVITCGLVRGQKEVTFAGNFIQATEGDMTVEGLLPNEVSAMKENENWQDTCETDSNGVVTMRITHPFWSRYSAPNPVYGLSGFPEYFASTSTGSIPLEYVAYQSGTSADGTTQHLSRACSMERWVPAESPVASVTWSTTRLTGETEDRLTDPIEQQRTAFNILTAGGAIDEQLPSDRNLDKDCRVYANPYVVPEGFTVGNCRGGSYASTDGVNHAPNMKAAVGFDTLVKEGDDNLFCFETNDLNGAGVQNKMVSYSFVHLPSYLPGWTTNLAPACHTKRDCKINRLDAYAEDFLEFGVDLNDPTATGLGATSLEVKDFGFSTLVGQDSFQGRLVSHPFECAALGIEL